jgi:hypothetical protein
MLLFFSKFNATFANISNKRREVQIYMKTDRREELNLKEVLDQLNTHISELIMIRELICRIKERDGR